MIRFRSLAGAAGKAKLWRYLTAMWLLARDRRTPFAPKLVAGLTLAYALSPIDLIPDFIPVLGQLDDLVIVPLGIALTLRLLPAGLWDEMLLAADQYGHRLPKMMLGLVLVLVIWGLLLGGMAWWIFKSISSSV